MAAEARIAARTGHLVRAGGGTAEGAAQAAICILQKGAEALVSFGLAGGLDPALRPGSLLIASTVIAGSRRFTPDPHLAMLFGGFTGHTILGGTTIVASRSAKREVHRLTGAHAVDLESGGVAEVAARQGVPFAAVRVICDPAERSLPAAALIALNARGGIKVMRVMGSVLRHPSQVGPLLQLARDARAGREALLRAIADVTSPESLSA